MQQTKTTPSITTYPEKKIDEIATSPQETIEENVSISNSTDRESEDPHVEQTSNITNSTNIKNEMITTEQPSDNTKINLGVEMTQIDTNEISLAKNLGVSVMRTPIRWEEVEPTQDNFDFSKFDTIVQLAEENNINLIFTIRGLSSWATVFTPVKQGGYMSSSMPKNMVDWDDFVGRIAERYSNSQIEISYEIENEVNSPAFWQGSIDEYIELLKRTYSIIKSKDSDAKVIASSLACGITKDIPKDKTSVIENKFKEDFIKIISSKSFDLISVHNYYYPDIEVNGFTFESYLSSIENTMLANGVNNPIWITETGFISQNTNVGSRTDIGNMDNQKERLKQVYNIATQHNIKKMLWIIIKDRDEVFFGSMGLLNSNNTPRPVGIKFKELTN